MYIMQHFVYIPFATQQKKPHKTDTNKQTKSQCQDYLSKDYAGSKKKKKHQQRIPGQTSPVKEDMEVKVMATQA
jgi:hypothetical protein